MQALTKLASFAVLSLVLAACNSDSSMSQGTAGTSSAHDTSMHASALDGSAFEVKLLDVKGAKGDEPDVLEFTNGRFHSRACDPYGFGTGAYATKANGGAVEFTATCKNDAGDRNDWRGIIRGDRIEGSFTWIPAHGDKVEKTYSGARMR